MKVKKLDEKNQSTIVDVKLDDSLACVVEVYHTLEALKTLKADRRFEMTHASNNRANLMKQVRQYQRKNHIYFSQDSSKTHYDVYANVKRKVLRADAVMKVNHLKIFHHHEMSRSDFLAYHASNADTDTVNTDTANADTANAES